ncbi:hypothetical protein ACFQX7_11715 [Luedemannella flava]
MSLRAAVVGGAVVAGIVSLATALREGGEALLVLQRFWYGTVTLSLLWAGLCAGGLAVARWARGRWPSGAEWRPRVPRERFNRVGGAVGLAAAAVGTFVLIRPDLMLDVLFGGRAAPAAYAAFEYDPGFLRWGAPAILAVLGAELVFLGYLVVRGRWDDRSRRVDIWLTVVLTAVMAAVLVAGPVYRARPTDDVVKFALLMFVILGVVDLVQKLRRARGRVELT